jgi:hypothetical protein
VKGRFVSLGESFLSKSEKIGEREGMNDETTAHKATPASGSTEREIPAVPGAAPGKVLPPEAVRALEEAEARRQAAPPLEMPVEIDGRREGEEPTRYGDWEKKGIAVDF